MGLTHAKILLSNPRKPEIEPIEINSLVDTGSYHLCISESIQISLELEIYDYQMVTLANNIDVKVPYVGPVRIDYMGRKCFIGAYVIGEGCLLGVIPMESMDLVVQPLNQKLVLNVANQGFQRL
jgi:clan AA aspartic protease